MRTRGEARVAFAFAFARCICLIICHIIFYYYVDMLYSCSPLFPFVPLPLLNCPSLSSLSLHIVVHIVYIHNLSLADRESRLSSGNRCSSPINWLTNCLENIQVEPLPSPLLLAPAFPPWFVVRSA